MKKAKKLFSALLAISLALSCALAGCGNKQQSDPGSGPASAPGGNSGTEIGRAHV